MHRGLEAAGDAAVDLRELPLRPVGRDHRRQVVVDAVVDQLIKLLPRPGRVRLRAEVVQSKRVAARRHLGVDFLTICTLYGTLQLYD